MVVSLQSGSRINTFEATDEERVGAFAPPAATGRKVTPSSTAPAAKTGTMATEDEIEAARRGDIGPRNPVVPVSGPRPLGRTLGLPIQMTWCWIFQENERHRTNPNGPKPRTDKEISAFMKAEFPDRTNRTFDDVTGCRRAYNNGVATRGIPPKVKSSEWTPTAPSPAAKPTTPAPAAKPTAPAPAPKPAAAAPSKLIDTGSAKSMTPAERKAAKAKLIAEAVARRQASEKAATVR